MKPTWAVMYTSGDGSACGRAGDFGELFGSVVELLHVAGHRGEGFLDVIAALESREDGCDFVPATLPHKYLAIGGAPAADLD